MFLVNNFVVTECSIAPISIIFNPVYRILRYTRINGRSCLIAYANTNTKTKNQLNLLRLYRAVQYTYVEVNFRLWLSFPSTINQTYFEEVNKF